jgi:hypothetical protein
MKATASDMVTSFRFDDAEPLAEPVHMDAVGDFKDMGHVVLIRMIGMPRLRTS